FAGETTSDAIAAILERQPDWRALPAATPPAVRRVLQRCLEKDPKRRLRDVADARLEIADAMLAAGTPLDASSTSTTPWQRWMLLVIGVVVGAAAVWAVFPRSVGGTAPAPSRRLIIPTSGAALDQTDRQSALTATRSFAISTDGTRLAYVAHSATGSRLFVRALDETDSHVIDGTDGASAPFWSPDGQSVAFFSGGKLKKVSLAS